MAFLKFIGSIILGGGLGYVLLCIASPNESKIIKHLPPYSSEPQSFFKLYKEESKGFMNQGKPNISLKQHKTQESTNTTEK